jgi:cell division protein FtsQ
LSGAGPAKRAASGGTGAAHRDGSRRGPPDEPGSGRRDGPEGGPHGGSSDSRGGQADGPQSGSGKAARRPHSPWKVALVVLLIAAALGAAGLVLAGSRLFVVREVEVRGERLVSRERVLAAARVSLGEPLVRVDTAAVRRRVASITEVESATVVRAWPAALRITVRERTPIVIAKRDGRYLHIDRYGVTVRAAEQPSAEPPAGPPRLVVDDPRRGDPATRAALAVLPTLPRDITVRLTAIEARTPESVTLRLRDGPTVVWGAPERAPEKLRALRTLLWSPKAARAKEIDVSSPEVVATR